MDNFEHPKKSLWLRLWQPFFNMSIYGKFALVLASFLLGYLVLGLHAYLFLNTIRGQLRQLPVDQELLAVTMQTIASHVTQGGVLVTLIMVTLSLTSFLCVRVLVSFLDQMICTLQSLGNMTDTSRLYQQGSLIPIISNDKIGTVATLVNEVTSDIRNISLFRRTIEADETTEEVYKRLADVFKEQLGLKTFVIWEVRAKDESIEAVYTWPQDLETESCVMSSANLCRAKRTGEEVSSSGNPNICPIFPLGDMMTHTCVPMVVSGRVLGVVQFLSLYVDCQEREKTLHLNLTRASQYLKEALPVLHAKRLAGNLQEMATRDTLTGLSNRRFLENNINHLIASLKRRQSQMGILMCDLDFFKKVNDEYGHDVGDKVLKGLAVILQNTVRSSDIIIRYGGEEFLILLTDCEETMVGDVAEKIRNAVEKEVFPLDNGSLRKTISVGTSLFPKDTDAFWECVKFADIALYKAKESGRNRVVNFEKSLWDSKEY